MEKSLLDIREWNQFYSFNVEVGYLESRIQSRLRNRMIKQGWYVTKFEGSTGGEPDLLCLRDGETVFIEVKQKGKKPRPDQIVKGKKHLANGFRVMYFDGEFKNDVYLDSGEFRATEEPLF